MAKESPNLKAIKRSGPFQENVALASIIDASHGNCDFKSLKFSEFLENIVGNLSLSLERSRFDLKIDENVTNFLNGFEVPFLLPNGTSVPEAFSKVFSTGSIKFGGYTKTPDSDQIDAIFDLANHNSKAIIECKKRSKETSMQEMFSIIEKALKYRKDHNITASIPVHFTFCRKLGEFKRNTKGGKILLEGLHDVSLNILRLRPRVEKDKRPLTSYFELVPWSKKAFPFNPDASMTIIIIEVELIQREFDPAADPSYSDINN